MEKEDAIKWMESELVDVHTKEKWLKKAIRELKEPTEVIRKEKVR